MTTHGGVNRFVLRWVVDKRGRVEALAAAAAAGIVVAIEALTARQSRADAFPPATRDALYISIAATCGALLGFVLTALAILLALPQGARLTQLQRNNDWAKVPETFLRAARALLLALVIVTAAMAVDNATSPRPWIEVPLAACLSVALVRVVANVVVLGSLVRVASGDRPASNDVLDP